MTGSTPIKRFIDCAVPVDTCNFRCRYCYITLRGKAGDSPPAFRYSPEVMAGSLSRERLGGTCLLNFCGSGETLFAPEMTELVRRLLDDGHYVMIVTNGVVTKAIDELLSLPPEARSRLMFKLSFHYLELRRLKVFTVFFQNLWRIWESGASFTLEITPCDELETEIENIAAMCVKEAGALCHVTVARDTSQKELPILTRHDRNEYNRIWSRFDSELFRFKLSVFGEKRREFCYAGDWTLQLLLGSGKLRQCNNGRVLQNVFENPEQPIPFCAVGHHCPNPHCYNAHAWLTLGAIPGFPAPTYADVRDRVAANGTHWLTPQFRAAVSGKFERIRAQYTEKQKTLADGFGAGVLDGVPDLEEAR